ncbi:hypothetical protein BDV06DRAFT_210016 [Aspergillus oleicola]
MLHTRLRPLPRAALHPHCSTSSASGATPDYHSEDDHSDEDPEDLFASFIQIPHLFPDDVPSFHGDPGQHLLYSSLRYGDIRIMVPSYPEQTKEKPPEEASGVLPANDEATDVEEGRRLFAHFVWSAGMVVSEGIELAESKHPAAEEYREVWSVRGEKVLELGAGAGLPSVTAALAGASAITITDHPSSPALGPTGALSFNTKFNIPSTTPCTIDIRPHEWGTTLEPDSWAVASKGTYSRIIAADCYWMASQHENLARTMKWFLAPEGRVWCVAGFHTGREIVAGFFETVERVGLVIERIFERDLNTSFEGAYGEREVRRKWMSEREDEGPENLRRWCVVAVLRHAPGSD